jgi:adenylate cyclase
VLVGNIGAQGKKMDYTIIGDHVNLGSRVEGLTRKYNVHILITEYTYERLKHAIEEGKFKDVEFREVEKVQVKGKEIPVTIYEVREKNE